MAPDPSLPKHTSDVHPPSWMALARPVVPDHELVRRVGGGSYGDVWLARTTLGTWRAVKVVFRDRFTDARPYEREFNGIRRFEPISRTNEAFVDVLQIGRNDAEGYFYYVMELADDATAGAGRTEIQPDAYVPKTLAKVLLQRGRLPVNECLELGLTLNLGLSHLHKAGLIHRDIKPSNIIFVGGVPKLADIGLVIELAEARSFVGTEGYIPPEGPNSPQADLYSLGKVLYEAGMGKDRKDFPEPFTQIAEAPDAAEMLEFNDILLKACAANREERYQSAEEMNADLALLQSGGSVRRQRKLACQLRFVQRAGALVTALAAIIALGWWWQAGQTRTVRRLVAETTRLAEENRHRVVRLDIANGVRLLDEGDAPAALLWFADALPLLTNRPAEETVHRIRIQQTLHQVPRVLHVLPHESVVLASDFSPDGRRIATGTMQGQLRLWDAQSGALTGPPLDMGNLILQLHFSADCRRLLVSSSPPQDNAAHEGPPKIFAAVLDAGSGREIFPRMSSNVVAVTFSPDGRWLATAQSDHVVRVFDTEDGHLMTELRGHNNNVLRLAFNADGKLLVSAGRDRTARLWRLPSGEPLGLPLPHDQVVRRATLSDDGRRLLTSTDPDSPDGDCVIQAWDTETGQKLGPPLKERGRVNGLFLDRPAGQRFFVAGRDHEVRVWDTAKQRPALPPLEMRDILACWAFSADGARLAVGSDDQRTRIWDTVTGELASPPLRHTAWVMSVRFSPDGKLCLTTGSDGVAKLWALGLRTSSATAKLASSLTTEPAYLVDPKLGREPGPLSLFTRDGSVRLLDPDRLVETRQLIPEKLELPANRCVTGPSGRQWAVFHWADRDSQSSEFVELWREEGGQLRHFVLTHPRGVQAVAFRPDGTHLLTGGKDGQVRIWNTVDGTLDRTIPLPGQNIQVWGFSRDAGKALLILKRSGPGNPTDLLQVVELEPGKAPGPSFQCPVGVSFAFDPHGTRVAAVSEDSFVRIFDVRTGQLASPPFRHPDVLLSLDWSADGRQLLAAGRAAEAMLSDAVTGEQLLSLLKTGNEATQIARWSPDSRFIVTRSNDGFARLWDAATAEAITPLLPHKGGIQSAFVTRSGRLVTVSQPNELGAWDLTETGLRLDVLADYAKLASGRRLSPTGVLLPLKAQELADLAASLRARAPELFAVP